MKKLCRLLVGLTVAGCAHPGDANAPKVAVAPTPASGTRMLFESICVTLGSMPASPHAAAMLLGSSLGADSDDADFEPSDPSFSRGRVALDLLGFTRALHDPELSALMEKRHGRFLKVILSVKSTAPLGVAQLRQTLGEAGEERDVRSRETSSTAAILPFEAKPPVAYHYLDFRVLHVGQAQPCTASVTVQPGALGIVDGAAGEVTVTLGWQEPRNR